MKKVYLALIILISFAFDARSQSPFQKEYHHFEIDTTIKATVLYNDNFYCLASDHRVLILNKQTNQIDHSYNDNSRAVGLEDIYLANDTLVGESRFDAYYLTKKNKWMLLRKGRKAPKTIYEDDKFIVTATCSGEWGGSLYFKDKKTNLQYECSCTCALDIHKDKNKYLVTASLSHMSGFANIFEIENPLKLKTHKKFKPNDKRIMYTGENESKSTQGTKQLIDSVGITIAANLSYNSKNYFLTEKFRKVSIDTVGNGKLLPVEDLTDMGIYAYDTSENRQCNDHQVSTFGNDKKTGFIDIIGNKLSFYIFDIKHN
jgi:hypothetical protein